MTHFLKKAATAVLVIIVAATANAQNKNSGDDFAKGSTVLNLGVGFGSHLYGSGYGMTVPPVSASLEFGVADNLFKNGKGAIGVAPYVGFAAYKFDDLKLTNINVGARGLLHYQFVNKLDTYTGLVIGYRIVKWNDDFLGSTVGNGLDAGWIIGGRYYFSNSFAGMLELGYGISYINLGIALKF